MLWNLFTTIFPHVEHGGLVLPNNKKFKNKEIGNFRFLWFCVGNCIIAERSVAEQALHRAQHEMETCPLARSFSVEPETNCSVGSNWYYTIAIAIAIVINSIENSDNGNKGELKLY